MQKGNGTDRGIPLLHEVFSMVSINLFHRFMIRTLKFYLIPIFFAISAGMDFLFTSMLVVL